MNMELQMLHVPTASLIGMFFSMVLSIGTPIALLVFLKKKCKADMISFFIGAGTFLLFAMVLEQGLHYVVMRLTGNLLYENLWLKAIYGGLAAGVFEETGRLLAMKYGMKKRLTHENALMYGVGHGGIEAILIVGLGYFSSIVTSVLLNTGQLETSLQTSVMDENTLQTAMTQLTTLATTPSWQFYLAGIERISAIGFHIVASYLVYLSIRNATRKWFFVAIFAHFLMDALAVVAAAFLPVIVVEILLLVYVGVFGYLVWTLSSKKDGV